MKALAMTFYTGETRVVEVEKPKIVAPADVVVKVHYSALDTGTTALVEKKWTSSFLHAKVEPLILGWHYAGEVDAAGADVEHVKAGDPVWGFLEYAPGQTQGSFSEYVRVRADQCARIPDGVDAKLAAAAATESLTALQGMRDHGGLAQSKSVLIMGAGGAVGSAGVGVAKRLGARVTALCSAKDVERVKSLGADEVLDRAKVDVFAIENEPRMFDVVFDPSTMYSPLQCFKLLNPNGSFVTTVPSLGFVAGKLLSLFNGKTTGFVQCVPKRKDFELVGEWLMGGLVIDIDSTFPIRDMKNAVARYSDKSKVGRVIIQVSGGW
jgi:NADPH:quinone reductase-like Zn-dependent oxidoreductase